MKSVKFTIISLAFLFSLKSFTCLSPIYTPGEYYVFYAYDKKQYRPEATTTEINISDWQKYTSNKATYEDTWDVVYRYSIAELEKAATLKESKNTFIQYLINSKDEEALKFLILAKKCEQSRSRRTDKWWYPTKEDLKFTDLKNILNEALAYKGKKLKTRYLLQAIRAAYTMGDYDLCLRLWNEQIKKQPASAVRTMCEDYIGGIYFSRGDYKTAIEHYANTMQSSSSFWWCADKLTENNSDIDRIKILYKFSPSAPELAVMVEKICREAENKANMKVFDGYDPTEYRPDDYWEGYGYNSYKKNRARYISLRDFALQVVSEKRSDSPAMWQYAAAFLTLIDGNPKLAAQYIAKADKLKGTAFIKNNIKVLQIMTDAMNGNYDTKFESAILPKLRWLDNMMHKNITKTIKEDYYDGSMFDNYSLYYYNDMMRKITLSIMAPRYLKRDQEARALLLSGMASERMRTIIDYRKQPQNYKWNIDFYTDVFSMMDSVSVEGVIQYKQTLQSGGKNNFERFLSAKCYKNNNYFNEIIGTKYMREERFDKAVEYLSKVSANYDSGLNIYEYFQYDPFYEPYVRRKLISPYNGYKLSFATRMLDLQNIKESSQSKETKAEATYQYALGLMRATNDCWALLRYKKGWRYPSDKFDEWSKPLTSHYNKLITRAISLSDNTELKAKCIAASLWLSGDDRYEEVYSDALRQWIQLINPASNFNKNMKLLSVDYVSTDISERLFSECDTFKSYKALN